MISQRSPFRLTSHCDLKDTRFPPAISYISKSTFTGAIKLSVEQCVSLSHTVYINKEIRDETTVLTHCRYDIKSPCVSRVKKTFSLFNTDKEFCVCRGPNAWDLTPRDSDSAILEWKKIVYLKKYSQSNSNGPLHAKHFILSIEKKTWRVKEVCP